MSNVKIIAISGGGYKKGARDYLPLAKGLGANSTIEKPFSKQELIDAVDAVLKNS